MRALLTIVGMSLLGTQCSQTARVPEHIPSLSIAIVEDGATYRDSNSHFHVAVTNISNERVCLFIDGSGIDRLSCRLINQDGKTWWALKIPVAYILDAPRLRNRELYPREKVSFNVRFGDLRLWEGFPRPKEKAVTVTMTAELQYRQYNGLAIWEDFVASKPKKFTFYPQ